MGNIPDTMPECELESYAPGQYQCSECVQCFSKRDRLGMHKFIHSQIYSQGQNGVNEGVIEGAAYAPNLPIPLYRTPRTLQSIKQFHNITRMDVIPPPTLAH